VILFFLVALDSVLEVWGVGNLSVKAQAPDGPESKRLVFPRTHQIPKVVFVLSVTLNFFPIEVYGFDFLCASLVCCCCVIHMRKSCFACVIKGSKDVS
jgi:hypothetical protein